MKKTDDKQFLQARAKAAAAARWDNHIKEVWTTIRITLSLKNQIGGVQYSLNKSTPGEAISALIDLYYHLRVMNQNGKLNKQLKVFFDDLKKPF